MARQGSEYQGRGRRPTPPSSRRQPADPCNKVAPRGIGFERQEGCPCMVEGPRPGLILPDAAQAGDRCNKAPAGRTATVIAPGLTGLVIPAAILQTRDDHAVRTPAALADAASTFEAHMP